MRRSRSQEHFDFKNFASQKYQKIIKIVNIFPTMKNIPFKKIFSSQKSNEKCLAMFMFLRKNVFKIEEVKIR